MLVVRASTLDRFTADQKTYQKNLTESSATHIYLSPVVASTCCRYPLVAAYRRNKTRKILSYPSVATLVCYSSSPTPSLPRPSQRCDPNPYRRHLRGGCGQSATSVLRRIAFHHLLHTRDPTVDAGWGKVAALAEGLGQRSQTACGSAVDLFPAGSGAGTALTAGSAGSQTDGPRTSVWCTHGATRSTCVERRGGGNYVSY